MIAQYNIRAVKLNIKLFTCGNREDKMELPFYDDDIKGMELYALKRENKYQPVWYISRFSCELGKRNRRRKSYFL